jgi:dTDP-4-dehydrorhamnose reductase
MLRLAHDREQMKVVNDQIGSPVWCGHIASTTIKVIESILNLNSSTIQVPPNIQGLYNLTAQGHTSWYGFAAKILALDPNKSSQTCTSLVAIPASEYPTPAQRPKWSVLDNSKLVTTFGVDVPRWEDQLLRCFDKA